jgi:hypothetical protein
MEYAVAAIKDTARKTGCWINMVKPSTTAK